jgi:hypothetical protein
VPRFDWLRRRHLRGDLQRAQCVRHRSSLRCRDLQLGRGRLSLKRRGASPARL